MKYLLLVVTITISAGCSSRSAYEGIQVSNKAKCAELPQAQYEACIASVSQTYEEYERARREALEKR